MSSARRDKDREQLELELASEGYRMLLHRLQEDSVLLRSFRTWEDTIAFMRTGVSACPAKDDILRPICQSHSEDHDPRWRTILLLIFWPSLKSLCMQKRMLDREYGELWASVV